MKDNNGMILGVCSKLSNIFNVDVRIFRAAFLIALLFYGTGLGAYLLLWIIFALSSK